MPKELQKEINIEINGNAYAVKFPNIGQMIDIETKKAVYSGGEYNNLLQSSLVLPNLAASLIDAISTFTVLIPELKTNLTIDNIFELDMADGLKITKAYNEVFSPWYLQWLQELEIVAKPKSTEDKVETVSENEAEQAEN